MAKGPRIAPEALSSVMRAKSDGLWILRLAASICLRRPPLEAPRRLLRMASRFLPAAQIPHIPERADGGVGDAQVGIVESVLEIRDGGAGFHGAEARGGGLADVGFLILAEELFEQADGFANAGHGAERSGSLLADFGFGVGGARV